VSLAAEQKEKEKRRLDIIVHNVEESEATDVLLGKIMIFQNIWIYLKTYFGVSVTIEKAFCLGKKSSKPRLLKISLGNMQQKSANLKTNSSSDLPITLLIYERFSSHLTLSHLNKSRIKNCVKSCLT